MSARYVSFTLAESRFGIPVEQVLQIIRPENLQEVPKAPAFVEGVINLHGDIIPVIDLRRRFGLAASAGPGETDSRKRRIVIVRFGQRPYGLDVDEVQEIVEIGESSVPQDVSDRSGGQAPFVSSVGRLGETMFLALDLAKVLDAGRVVQTGAG